MQEIPLKWSIDIDIPLNYSSIHCKQKIKMFLVTRPKTCYKFGSCFGKIGIKAKLETNFQEK